MATNPLGTLTPPIPAGTRPCDMIYPGKEPSPRPTTQDARASWLTAMSKATPQAGLVNENAPRK